jgi:hypothetical protein
MAKVINLDTITNALRNLSSKSALSAQLSAILFMIDAGSELKINPFVVWALNFTFLKDALDALIARKSLQSLFRTKASPKSKWGFSGVVFDHPASRNRPTSPPAEDPRIRSTAG